MVTRGRPPADQSAWILLWDLPVRIAHWSFVVLVLAAWITIENGWLGWHKVAGYGILFVTIFRLLWGVFGSSTARFSHFLRGPRAVIAYARAFFSGSPHATIIGHNPLGGWSVAALLLLLLTQSLLGLFATDEYGTDGGPLSSLMSFDAARRAAMMHGVVFNLLMAFIVLHVAAVTLHFLLKRDNLVAPMVSGRKRIAKDAAPVLTAGSPKRLALAWIASALIVGGIATFSTEDRRLFVDLLGSDRTSENPSLSYDQFDR